MGFSFAKQGAELNLEIEGKDYRVLPFSDECKKALEIWYQDINSIDKETDNDINRLCQKMEAFIDGILGAESYKNILGGREITFYALQSFVAFLFQEIHRARLINSVKLVGGKLDLDVKEEN